MLNITSGLPGAGKTLYTLGLVEKLRQQTGREVYYAGIDELTLPWKPIEARSVEEAKPTIDWASISDGSIVFLDEAWRYFPIRKQGSAVPPHVEFLATHRHHGLDIFLVTQHPQQIDTFARKLIERHYHVSRKFGRERVTIYQWERVADPTSEKDQKEALATRWSYDKSRFGWYRSAFAHTRQRDFPVKVIVSVVGLSALLVALIWYTVQHVRGSAKPATTTPTATATDSKGLVASVAAAVQGNPWAASWRAPRISGRLDTAPMYDDLNRKIVSVPRAVGCMQLVYSDGRTDCRCTTDQGTDAEVSESQCLKWMDSGIYNPYRVEPDRKQYSIDYLNQQDKGPSSTDSVGGKDNASGGQPVDRIG